MTAIAQNYNIKVQSRFYAFLDEDLESADPETIIASLEKKKEKSREIKIKARKDKKVKQQEDVKVVEVKEEIKESAKSEWLTSDQEEEEIITSAEKDPIVYKELNTNDESNSRPERNNRGRGRSFRRNNREGGRRINSSRNDGNFREGNVRDGSVRDGNYRSGNRREASNNDDNFKMDFFEEKSSYNNQRGGSTRGRRPFRSRGNRFNRGGFSRSSGEEFQTKEDEFPENIGTFEEMQQSDGVDSAPIQAPQSSRGSYPYRSRGRPFNNNFYNNRRQDRFSSPPPAQSSSQPVEDQDDSSFNDKHTDYKDQAPPYHNTYYQGSRGPFNPSRGRRGSGSRGGDRRPMRSRGGRGSGGTFNRSFDNSNREYHPNQHQEESRKQPSYDETNEFDDSNTVLNKEHANFSSNEVQLPTANEMKSHEIMDFKKSNWCEIEDDHNINTMTLEEYRAANLTNNPNNNSNSGTGNFAFTNTEVYYNSRKANDGQDVFSGMEVYRKDVKGSIGGSGGGTAPVGGTSMQIDEDFSNSSRQKVSASIPVSIRFSRGSAPNHTSSGQSMSDNHGSGGAGGHDDNYSNSGYRPQRGGGGGGANFRGGSGNAGGGGFNPRFRGRGGGRGASGGQNYTPGASNYNSRNREYNTGSFAQGYHQSSGANSNRYNAGPKGGNTTTAGNNNSGGTGNNSLDNNNFINICNEEEFPVLG